MLNVRLRERRMALGMTLDEVGRLIGVKGATVQRYESGGIRNIKRSTIAALARALQCSPAYLTGWDSETPPVPPREPKKKGHRKKHWRDLAFYQSMEDAVYLNELRRGQDETSEDIFKREAEEWKEGDLVLREQKRKSLAAKQTAQKQQDLDLDSDSVLLRDQANLVFADSLRDAIRQGELPPRKYVTPQGQPPGFHPSPGVYHIPENPARVDFYLRARGNCLSNARIHDGDIVFIHAQDKVQNGEIAAVELGPDTILGRFYQYGDVGCLMPDCDDPEAKPFYVKGMSKRRDFAILGKVIAIQTCVQ